TGKYIYNRVSGESEAPNVTRMETEDKKKKDPNITFRPSTFETGTVSSVPRMPPTLNSSEASDFQPSTNRGSSVPLKPRAAAAACARLPNTSGANALQLHQVTSAEKARSDPVTVSRSVSPANSSAA